MAMPELERRSTSGMPNYATQPLAGQHCDGVGRHRPGSLQPAPMPGMPMPMGGVSMSTAFVYLSYVQAACLQCPGGH